MLEPDESQKGTSIEIMDITKVRFPRQHPDDDEILKSEWV